ncbi:Synaptic vesicle glycoprotein 2B [Amphibalanus amphitrite]|uniref:Synaptic vesicle glycoprotein 2B n=1 Tax=Amphibalanus amphitrite TaxID=1232801 RepID=A0A6A4X0A8_AMPAM|nr:Synaptic vesicle glycoprotein 2B [Amphibalanus amphitrite]
MDCIVWSRHVTGAGPGGADAASSESASLVRHATNPFMCYTEGGAPAPAPDAEGAAPPAIAPPAAPLADTAELDTEDSVLSQFHEDAIRQAGVGSFQLVLFLVLGLSLAADTIELFVVAYVIPRTSPATPARRLPRPSVLVFALRAALEFAAASWSSHRDGV